MGSNEIGVMISTIRAARGLTQKQLSKMSGVAESYISSFETGRLKPSTYHIKKIEEALHIKFEGIKPTFDAFIDEISYEDNS